MFDAAATVRLARHDWVRLDASAWAAAVHERAALRGTPLLSDWAARNRPLIVRRVANSDPADQVPLGLPLPPAHGKQRIRVSVPASAICEVAPSPRLADVVSSAPIAWHPCINRLLRLDDSVRVFGSLAWQHLTGLEYLSPTSDLDLLWRHDAAVSSEALLEGIRVIEQQAPMRIDGELVGADGIAVHWRELLSGAEELLGKRLERVAFISRGAFLAGRGGT